MMTRKQHVDYWLHGAAESMKDMRAAIKSKRRSNAMFCGHLAVEKMLKALCAVRSKTIYREHNLLKLAKESGLTATLTKAQQEEKRHSRPKPGVSFFVTPLAYDLHYCNYKSI